jgi:hypothetical protein
MISNFDSTHIENRDIINDCPSKVKTIINTKKSIKKKTTADSHGIIQFSYGFNYGKKMNKSIKTSERDYTLFRLFLEGEDE